MREGYWLKMNVNELLCTLDRGAHPCSRQCSANVMPLPKYWPADILFAAWNSWRGVTTLTFISGSQQIIISVLTKKTSTRYSA